MTRTMTSKAPGSGTSISSTWKASIGSPSRSWRMTHAAMVAGRSPGSASTCDTCVISTAISVALPVRLALLYARVQRRSGTLPAAEIAGAQEEHGGHDQRQDHPTDAEDQERLGGVDVVDQPPEVHPEEAGGEGQRQEDGGHDGQAAGHLVDEHVDRLGEQLAQIVDLGGGDHEIVVDVAERVAGDVALEAGQVLEQVAAAGQHLALGRHDLL